MYPRLFGELTTVESYTNQSRLLLVIDKMEFVEAVKISIWVQMSIF